MAKAKKKRPSLREPEGAVYSPRATRPPKKKTESLPSPRKSERLPFPPFLPDDPAEAARLVRAEIKRRLADIEAGRDKPLPVKEAFAEVRAEIRKRRAK
jgi:hypothetical protein